MCEHCDDELDEVLAPLKVGGVDDAGRIEVPGGDLHQNGGLNGQLLDLDQARAAVAAGPTPAEA